jgi:CRISPR/Cas system-associated exonuclease Cas4 (RecB family)
MKPFLKIVAEDLYKSNNGCFENVTIIFPNKRASLFFNQYLAEINGNRPMWLPKYMTINDIFNEISPFTTADPILLVCLLYQSYVKITKSDEPLDKFFAWGEVMLQDFNDIDNSMIPADKLFANIDELDNLTDFSFLSETQKETIKNYFVGFNPQKHTKLKEKFGSLWCMMYPIYNDFKEVLSAQGYAYDGMLKREVANQLGTYTSSHPQIPSDHIYAIVGFNVLNKTEQTLFSYLKQHHQAYFYWDYDHSYMSSDSNINFEAGQFIRQNILKYGDKLAYTTSERDNMRSKKHVSIISAPTENAQARYVSQWLPQVVDAEQPLNNTSVILCNESLLQPVFHSIPSELTFANGKTRPISTNITMGHPLSQTSVATFIDVLIELQLKGSTRNNDAWRHATAIRALSHPFTSRLTDGISVNIADKIKMAGTVYPTTQDVTCGNAVLTQIFDLKNSNSELLAYLSSLIELLGKTFKCDNQLDKNDFIGQLNIESIYNTHKIINRLINLHQASFLNSIKRSTLGRLIRQIIAIKNIPFHGEPATGMQIMGMLETRNLDFKNILILSANEGNMPPSPNLTSFIPYSLREAYGMNTIEKQTSLYAYYFYRIIQRAENICIMYNSSTEGACTNGEMSRFITQLLIHGNNLLSSASIVKTFCLQSPSIPMERRDIYARKSVNSLERLNSLYNCQYNDKGKTMTPSVINTYIDCPLKFYFNKIAPIPLNPNNVIDEDVDNALFGNIIHHVLERIYKPYIGKTINEHQLTQIVENSKEITRLVDEEIAAAFFPKHKTTPVLSGQQLLNRNVIIDYIRRQLIIDTKACPLKIIELENNEHKLLFSITQQTTVQLGGIIDRIDSTNIEGKQTMRIVDYKTSANPHLTLDIATLFNPEAKHRPYHILQALTYTLVVASANNTSLPISPSLFYVKKTQNIKPIDSVVKINKDPILQFAPQNNPDKITEEFCEELRTTLETLFNPDIPFTQSSNTDICEYCDFKQICSVTR